MDVDSVDREYHYINHMIKTRLPKSNGVLVILQRKCLPKPERELDIIRGASHQLLMCLPAKHKIFKELR